ncbi:YihY/virulence factor BrkB family protein [Pseudooceanicola sp. LIPI14-2-Ac024]|uniref:YihY/virulence factor BrkB family protein n=1 Tax=Pseudooceanicola sp. LIPI14-2-Ac024 TaxID=3344875 RepID=UPI0035CEB14D
MTETSQPRPGARSRWPSEIPARGWLQVLGRVFTSISRDHLSTLSAGIAFFALFAIFPAIAALVMMAGIAIQPPELAQIIDGLAEALPQEAATIITDQVEQVVSDDSTALNIALLFSLALALFSASAGIRTLMDGLNAAYRETEKRSFIVFYATGLGLTLMMIVGFILASFMTLAIPILQELLPLPPALDAALTWLRWPIFAVLVVFGLGVIFRYGPSRRPARWRWLSPGAVAATLVWIAFSAAFSAYVRNFGSYTETYGALAGVIILMTWLWLSALIVLLGAELDAELEHQVERDTTTGPDRPKGERGAVVADTDPPAM